MAELITYTAGELRSKIRNLEEDLSVWLQLQRRWGDIDGLRSEIQQYEWLLHGTSEETTHDH